MMERVGICAVAQTKYSPERADVYEGELAYEAIKQVLEEMWTPRCPARRTSGTAERSRT